MSRTISLDSMNQGTHIDVTPVTVEDGEYHPLAIICDCGDTISGATSAATVAAWTEHIEQDDEESEVQNWDES